MDNRIMSAQEQRDQELNANTPSDSGQPPVVIQNNQGGGGSGGVGVFAAVALVALVVLGVWWFGFGPGAGTPANTESAPPAQSSAPVESSAPVQSAPATTTP